MSGLEEGIDTAAHQAALAAGGHTVAVIGTPLNESFPAKNREPQERLMREQLVVSQFPLGAPSQRKNFPMRNRTMARLTDATVIVEAAEKSGTLYQGWEALRLGRLLYLMESVASDPALSWPAEMIRYGAQVLSDANLQHVLAEMPSLSRGRRCCLMSSSAAFLSTRHAAQATFRAAPESLRTASREAARRASARLWTGRRTPRTC